MNLKNSHNDMARFPLFVDVIHNYNNVSKPPQDIYKSNVAIIVVASIRVGRTQCSMVLLTMDGTISLLSYHLLRKVIWRH
jgi:hypothetical protein